MVHSYPLTIFLLAFVLFNIYFYMILIYEDSIGPFFFQIELYAYFSSDTKIILAHSRNSY